MLLTRKQSTVVVILAFVFLQLMGPSNAAEPQSSPQVFTLEDAVNYALAHYPGVQASREQVMAARGGVALSLTNYLPQLDSLWQGNRATSNNEPGIAMPQAVVPSIRGPVFLPSSNTAWGSIGGLLFSWQPYAFGYRRAKVNLARAAVDLASANLTVTRLTVATNAVNAFFNLLAAEQDVRVAQANVKQWQVVDRSVHNLVDNQLRPGADASRADAELARANITLVQAQQQEDINRAALADALGIRGTGVEAAAGPLLGSPPSSTPTAPSLSTHPTAVAQNDQVRQAHAQLRILQRSYYPGIYLQSFASGLGSGFSPDGNPSGGVNGLGFRTGNYGAALTVNFPLFSIFAIHAQEKTAAANERTQANLYNQTLLGIDDQVEQAEAMLRGARRVADNTVVELRATRTGEIQSRTRYQRGLATIVELAEAENLFQQAEIDDALARLAVWRNLGDLAAAEGNLEPFFGLVRTGGH